MTSIIDSPPSIDDVDLNQDFKETEENINVNQLLNDMYGTAPNRNDGYSDRKHRLSHEDDQSFMATLSNAICPVCHEELRKFTQHEILVIPKCGHMICARCLKIFIQVSENNKWCPVCRGGDFSPHDLITLHPSFP